MTLVFGAQLGKSEVANNWIGWNIDHSPSPMLMVQPNNKVAEKYSKMRIAPMIKDSPCLAAKVSSPKQRERQQHDRPKAIPRRRVGDCRREHAQRPRVHAHPPSCL